MKYNLALLPTTLGPSFTALAQQFSKQSDIYLLGPQSLPHLSLCHFEADATKLENLWQKACELFPEKELTLCFKRLEYHEHNKHSWLLLIPETSSKLLSLQQSLAELQGQKANDYFPHLTLSRLKPGQHTAVNATLKTLSIAFEDRFYLSLGQRDAVGQFIAPLFKAFK